MTPDPVAMEPGQAMWLSSMPPTVIAARGGNPAAVELAAMGAHAGDRVTIEPAAVGQAMRT